MVMCDIILVINWPVKKKNAKVLWKGMGLNDNECDRMWEFSVILCQ